MTKPVGIFFGLLKEAGRAWQRKAMSRQAAALAYYLAFSFTPLLVIAIDVAGFVIGRRAALGEIETNLRQLLGPTGAAAITALETSATRPTSSALATLISLLILLFGAAGVFEQIREALDIVWDVEPPARRGFIRLLRKRFLSIVMVIGSAFLLLCLILVTTGLEALEKSVPGAPPQFGLAINICASLVVMSGLFAVIFRLLPDASVRWNDVWPGAIFAAVLFIIGQLLIGLYLGRTGIASYGAAASVLLVLIWLYYSAQIFLFGAEFAHAYASRRERLAAERSPADRDHGPQRRRDASAR